MNLICSTSFRSPLFQRTKIQLLLFAAIFWLFRHLSVSSQSIPVIREIPPTPRCTTTLLTAPTIIANPSTMPFFSRKDSTTTYLLYVAILPARFGIPELHRITLSVMAPSLTPFSLAFDLQGITADLYKDLALSTNIAYALLENFTIGSKISTRAQFFGNRAHSIDLFFLLSATLQLSPHWWFSTVFRNFPHIHSASRSSLAESSWSIAFTGISNLTIESGILLSLLHPAAFYFSVESKFSELPTPIRLSYGTFPPSTGISIAFPTTSTHVQFSFSYQTQVGFTVEGGLQYQW